jgi:hypothetical protein
VVSHLGRKNKDAPKVGHPEIFQEIWPGDGLKVRESGASETFSLERRPGKAIHKSASVGLD